MTSAACRRYPCDNPDGVTKARAAEEMHAMRAAASCREERRMDSCPRPPFRPVLPWFPAIVSRSV